jgi:hypothetical protein
MSKTVIGRILADELVTPKEIERAFDDAVADWHAAPMSKSLAAYLGFKKDEYAAWAECYDSLWLILRARRERRPLGETLRNYGKRPGTRLRIATRNARPGERKRILSWLKRSGRTSNHRSA